MPSWCNYFCDFISGNTVFTYLGIGNCRGLLPHVRPLRKTLQSLDFQEAG